MNDMKELSYPDAIERVMLDNGGYAPLPLLYQGIWAYKDKAKAVDQDPNATIRRAVQTAPRFVKIGLGVYAVKALQDAGNLPAESPARTPKERRERRHTTIEGMLIEIGNNTDGVAYTYTPDRNGIFQNKKLGSIATLERMPDFTFPHVLEVVGFADVIWFNRREYPIRLYEVEDTGNFRNALMRFCELQDFRAEFYCISEAAKEGKYKRELGRAAYDAVAESCEFRTYEDVEADYETRMRKLRL